VDASSKADHIEVAELSFLGAQVMLHASTPTNGVTAKFEQAGQVFGPPSSTGLESALGGSIVECTKALLGLRDG